MRPGWAAAVLAAPLLAGCVDAGRGQRTNPLFAGADPSVLIEDGQTWLFPTGGGDRLYGWARTADGWRRSAPLIRMSDIAWIADGAPEHFLWAPHAFRANGRYYLFYSVGPQNPTPSRIGVATSDRIDGPYIDSGRPLLTGGNGFEAIDPMVFADPALGKTYLLAGGSAGARLRMFELAPDLLTLAREVAIEQPERFTEAPFLHRRGDLYYLSYSHGSYNRGNYSVAYSTAPGATGPWTYRGEILASAGRYKGPGHHAFFENADGSWSIAYHRWEDVAGEGPYRGQRQVAIDRVEYRDDGSIAPIVMTP
ncbi:family 43 glycosylhydrolase [Sphingomonas japonica]|uniref:Beta-xylosidase n=1 Tax=Sphingomonas japonica TaxID=511662 RepID=A0ABX0U185_9SPHN|nr:family 43 glycosylhydrolase [Sphingomonas japonica]NIJ23127.1 beta-xylosidase [Sphingomonas japonica]